MSRFAEVGRRKEFDRDLKRLIKKYRSLEDDLETFIDTELKMFHKLGLENHYIYPIPDLGFVVPAIFKATRFACRSLKGTASNSGIRVIYAYFEEEDIIELIEIYNKQDKENEDRERIKLIYRH